MEGEGGGNFPGPRTRPCKAEHPPQDRNWLREGVDGNYSGGGGEGQEERERER